MFRIQENKKVENVYMYIYSVYVVVQIFSLVYIPGTTETVDAKHGTPLGWRR